MSAPSLPSLLVSHWQLQPGLDLAAFLYAALYLGAARRVQRWPARRSVAFLCGIGTVLVALQSGLDSFDDRLLSVHMVQHMLLLLVAPALLVLGHPALLAMRALPPARRAGAAQALSRLRPLTGPVVCLGVFYAALLLSHQPGFYGATLGEQGLHEAEHALYLVAGTLLWWPILGGDPVPSRRLGGLGTVVYMLAAMPPMALIGALLNRHTTLVYASYGPAGRPLGVSALADQAQAGAIMWVAGNMIMIAAGLWAAVAAMLAEERRTAAREARGDTRLPLTGPPRGGGGGGGGAAL